MNTLELTTLESEPVVTSSPASWKDWLGIVASIGCAIHCAAMPFVIAYLPALGLSFLADEAFHKWMALVCFLIAIVAFIPGIRRHGNWIPISVGAVGLGLITYAAFGLAGECCASCEAIATTAVVSEEGTAACESCEHCAACETNAAEASQATSSETDGESISVAVGSDKTDAKNKTLLALLAPWLTPLGGCLLVTAHLLNKRFGCLCSCCQ